MNVLIESILEAETICIFRHQSPDPDALGSQFGLLSWIQEKFPEKKVYAMGFHRGMKAQLYGSYELISEEQMKSATAIILDTANQERIDDQRYQLCRKRVKIDHHPNHDAYAEVEYVDVLAASTAEIVCILLRAYDQQIFSESVARYLYMGVVSDTLRFSTANTRKESFECAAYLMQSKIDLIQINDEIFGIEDTEFFFSNYIRHHATIEDNGLVYIIISLDLLKRLNIHPGLAKEKIYEFNQVRSFKIWAMFIESDDELHPGYNVSIRSRQHTINDIAALYRGGGHRLAAAAKHLSLEQVEDLLQRLRERLEMSVL
jgi:bifunctional oligoribonuclease and PAP phosphatase NrnA